MSGFYGQPLRIQTYDIDFAGIVSNIVFVRWLEDLRLGLMEQAYPLIRALAKNVTPILLATRISYRRPVTIADQLVGRMRVSALGRVRWQLAAEFSVGALRHLQCPGRFRPRRSARLVGASPGHQSQLRAGRFYRQQW